MNDIEKYRPKLKIIGNNLKRLRTTKGLTQKELAKEVGVTADYIRKIENAKVLFSIDLLCKFCVLFKTQPKELFKD